jgi:hypothetical protein
MENPQVATAVGLVTVCLALWIGRKGKAEWDKAAAELEAESAGKKNDGPSDMSTGKSSVTSAAARGADADDAAGDVDDFDEDLVEQIQEETIPKALRFESPGRKANLSIFVEGKRQRKSPARFVAKN